MGLKFFGDNKRRLTYVAIFTLRLMVFKLVKT